MGLSASTIPKEELSHPALFYEGRKAANDNRFTVSELCFAQALQAHPGRAFWEKLLKTVFTKPGKAAAASGGLPSPVSPRESAKSPRARDGDAKKNPAMVPVTLPSVLHTAEAANPLETGRAEQSNDTSISSRVDPLAGIEDGSQPSPHKTSLTHTGNATENGTAISSEQFTAHAMGAATDFTLPLDGNLKHLMYFVRMLSDMSVTYLRLLPTTAHPAKVVTLASRYTSMAITHAQVLLHIFTMMKEDETNPVPLVMQLDKANGKDEASVEGSDESKAERVNNAKVRMSSHTASKSFTLCLVIVKLRYFLVSALINHVQLLLRTLVEQTERKRQNVIFTNAMDHLDAVYGIVRELAEEYPDEYLSKLIVANVPKGNSDTRRTPADSQCASSQHQSVAASLSLGDDAYRHIYSGGRAFTGTQSALVPLLAVHGVRMSVQEGVPTRLRAKIHSPAERMGTFYICWWWTAMPRMVPGRNPYTLQQAFAHAMQSKDKEGNRLLDGEVYMGPPLDPEALQSPTAAQRNREHQLLAAALANDQGDGEDERSLQSDIRGPMRLALDALVKKRGIAAHAHFKEAFRNDAFVKPKELDFTDARTLVIASGEEILFLATQALKLSAIMRIACNQRPAADRHLRSIENIVAGLFGPDSQEVKMVRFSNQVDCA